MRLSDNELALETLEQIKEIKRAKRNIKTREFRDSLNKSPEVNSNKRIVKLTSGSTLGAGLGVLIGHQLAKKKKLNKTKSMIIGGALGGLSGGLIMR